MWPLSSREGGEGKALVAEPLKKKLFCGSHNFEGKQVFSEKKIKFDENFRCKEMSQTDKTTVCPRSSDTLYIVSRENIYIYVLSDSKLLYKMDIQYIQYISPRITCSSHLSIPPNKSSMHQPAKFLTTNLKLIRTKFKLRKLIN